jgi:Tfx family DNA-binding protein
MRVLVEVFATLRERLGWSLKSVEFSCDEVTLEDLLKSVKDLHDLLINDLGGDLSSLLENYLVFINGIHAQFRGGLRAVLRDNDKVSIFPPVAGGVLDTFLTEKQITVLRLKAQGLTVEDIASILGVSKSNVYSLLRSARKVFEKSLRTVKVYNELMNNVRLVVRKGTSINDLIKILISEADNHNIKIPLPTYELVVRLIKDTYGCVDLISNVINCDLTLNLDSINGVNIIKS